MMYNALLAEIESRRANWTAAWKALEASGLTDDQMDTVFEMLTGPVKNVMVAASDAGMITDDEYDSLHDMMADVFR